MTNKALLSKINIPHENVHRIKGEEDPEAEAERYSKEINDFVRNKNEAAHVKCYYSSFR
jgi:6-phosphogluconolactonase